MIKPSESRANPGDNAAVRSVYVPSYVNHSGFWSAISAASGVFFCVIPAMVPPIARFIEQIPLLGAIWQIVTSPPLAHAFALLLAAATSMAMLVTWRWFPNKDNEPKELRYTFMQQADLGRAPYVPDTFLSAVSFYAYIWIVIPATILAPFVLLNFLSA